MDVIDVSTNTDENIKKGEIEKKNEKKQLNRDRYLFHR